MLKGCETIVQSAGPNIFRPNFLSESKKLVVFVHKDGNRTPVFFKHRC